MISEDNEQIDILKSKIHEEYEHNSLFIKDEDIQNMKLQLKKLFDNFELRESILNFDTIGILFSESSTLKSFEINCK